MGVVTEREYRFIGGPRHGEHLVTAGQREFYVPMREQITAARTEAVDVGSLRVKVAVYVLTGDYEAERVYRFDRIDRR